MAFQAFSEEWAGAYRDEINNSQAYGAAAKGWKWTVGLVVEAEPDKNWPETRGLYMDLYDGAAREIRVVGGEEARACDFAITGTYTRWKEVATGKLDATRGMLQGKLRLKGNLPTIVRYTKAAQELTACTMRVPVEWPDEAR